MTTPAAWAVAGALWVGCLWARSPWDLAVAAVVLAVAAVVRRRPDGRSGAGLRLVLVAVAVLLVGSGLAAGREALMGRGPLSALAEAGGQAELTGTVVTEPRESVGGAWLLVRVDAVDRQPTRERALLRTGGLDEAPPFGGRVRLTATARPLEHEDFERHLRRMHAAVEVSPVGALEVVGEPGAFVGATNRIRSRVRAASRRHLAPDPAALLAGLVTGDTAGLSPETEQVLADAGLTHLVAVSGSNVALVLGGAIGIAALTGLGARGRRRVAVVAAISFAILTRAEPSVLRATAMALLVLAGQATGRGGDARHTLPVAATLLLLVDPFLAGQLGFVLSVSATAGVLVAGPAIAARVPGPRPFALLVGASAGAQLGVAPALLATEGTVPVASLAANLVAVPAAALASAVGVAAAVVAQVSVGAGGAMAVVAAPAVQVVLLAGRTFASGPTLGPVQLLTPVAVVLVVRLLTGRRAPRLAAAALACALVLGLFPDLGRAGSVDHLTLTALDIGQGDALLVEAPSANGTVRMLVDGGPDPELALELLRRRGIRRLDVVAASHPHADHTNGLPAVLSRLDVGAVVTAPPIPVEPGTLASSVVAVTAVARTRSVPVVTVAAGDRFDLGSTRVEVLGPPGDGSLGNEPNDNSLVLRLVGPTGSVLLTGDAEEAAQRRLLARPDLLAADVLKVPHHGGNTNADGFLDAVGATTAVIGVGADNDYGHPHPDVLADLIGSTILRTDTGGTVTVQVP